MIELPGKPNFICKPDDERWLPARSQGVGASESAAAAGVSKWESPLELYLRKVGTLPPKEANLPMRIGSAIEPFIADEFEATVMPLAERSPGLFQSSELPWVLATPDAIVDPETLAEFKWVGDARYAGEILGSEETDEIPVEWVCQAQQQMFVTGAVVVLFGVLIGKNEFRRYKVERHAGAIEGLTNCVSEFWARVKNLEPPELEVGAARAKELIKELFPNIKAGECVTLSDHAGEMWAEWEALGKEIKPLKKRRDELKAAVQYELGEAEAGRFPDGRFLRRKLIKKKPQAATEYIDCRDVKNWP